VSLFYVLNEDEGQNIIEPEGLGVFAYLQLDWKL